MAATSTTSAPERRWPELTAPERRAVLDALVTIIVTMGGALSTAYLVAAEFARGVEDPAVTPRRWPR